MPRESPKTRISTRSSIDQHVEPVDTEQSRIALTSRKYVQSRSTESDISDDLRAFQQCVEFDNFDFITKPSYDIIYGFVFDQFFRRIQHETSSFDSTSLNPIGICGAMKFDTNLVFMKSNCALSFSRFVRVQKVSHGKRTILKFGKKTNEKTIFQRP